MPVARWKNAAALIVACWCVALLGMFGAAATGAEKPNFVIIMADDLGYGDLACYGHPTIRTPELDRMAAEGMRLTQFYSGAPVCTPSRAALMTGRYPARSGLCGQRRVLFPDSTGGLPDSEITLAEALAPAGYRSICIGKWHLGYQPQYLPPNHGFEHYFGIPYSNDMGAETAGGRLRGWPKTPLIRDLAVIEEDPDQTQLTRRYTEEAVAFLREAATGDRPFLLYLPHTMPHVPIFASEKFQGKSPRGLYGDVITELDWSTGEILRTLRETGLASRTLVFFTSDNGPWLSQGLGGGSAGLLREGKGSTWEGGVRVPGIAWWPDHVPGGRVSPAIASAMDLFTTCVALAGAPQPADRPIDGLDISPVLLDDEPGPRQTLFFYRDTEVTAVRHGPWKAHFKTQSGYGQPKPEPHDPPLLYNLDRDPSEKIDVARRQPEVVAELTRLATEHAASFQPAPSQLDAPK